MLGIVTFRVPRKRSNGAVRSKSIDRLVVLREREP